MNWVKSKLDVTFNDGHTAVYLGLADEPDPLWLIYHHNSYKDGRNYVVLHRIAQRFVGRFRCIEHCNAFAASMIEQATREQLESGDKSLNGLVRIMILGFDGSQDASVL